MPLISILLVEDEKDALELLAIILTSKFPDLALTPSFRQFQVDFP